jgi:hypothetical protein
MAFSDVVEVIKGLPTDAAAYTQVIWIVLN